VKLCDRVRPIGRPRLWVDSRKEVLVLRGEKRSEIKEDEDGKKMNTQKDTQ
jgi:hypothetical protein